MQQNTVSPLYLELQNTNTVRVELGNTNGNIKAIFHKNSFLKETESIPSGEAFGLILDLTNFYAESGGQEADTGRIVIDGGAEFDVTDVQVFSGYVLHVGKLQEGNLKVDDEVTCTYNEVSPLCCHWRPAGLNESFRTADALFKVITLQRTSSTLVFEKSWATILTRKARL